MPFNSETGSSLFIYLAKANKEVGFYGYFLEDLHHNLLGAILTPVQFSYKSAPNSKIILNLSSWYMNKSVRGAKAIIFAKDFLNDLAEYKITDFTASKSAEAIFKYLGFRYMNGVNRMDTIFSCLSLKFFHYQRLLKISLADILIKFPELENYANLENVSCFCYELKGYKFYIIGLKKIRVLKKIKIPIYQILWISNEFLMKKFSQNICFLLMIKFKVIAIYYAIESDKYLTFNSIKRLFTKKDKLRYLIKSDSILPKFIPPLGSEISTNFIL